MELKFKTDEKSGFCFTPCPFFKDVMINSNDCSSCVNNYGVTDVGKLRCKGNRDGKN